MKDRNKRWETVLLLTLLTLAAGGCAVVSNAETSMDKAGIQSAEQTQDAQQEQNAGQAQDMVLSPADNRTAEELETRQPDYGQKNDIADKTQEDKEPELFYEKDGRQYTLVPDLVTGEYLWASVLSEGTLVKDSHGHERTDYNSQKRYFETVGAKVSHEVRRWDNLLYSAGEYLIFEYDGTIHISEHADLYHPVLSYAHSGTYGRITKVPQGYMIADEEAFEVRFYDGKFQETLVRTGLRAGESGHYYEDGRMAVRDMKTGLKGFMDENGELVIPCRYAVVSDFSNGYASVLTDAEVVPYTEDAGTVQMFYGKGGQWGIIDREGRFVIEPCERYANQSPDQTDVQYDAGIRRFGPVREDGTVDFLAADQDERVLETISVR